MENLELWIAVAVPVLTLIASLLDRKNKVAKVLHSIINITEKFQTKKKKK